MKLPRKLYHGTSLENVDSILKHGLKAGTIKTCSQYTRESGYMWDCVGNVSLAKNRKDAIFFATTSMLPQMTKDNFPSQAIFEVDPLKLDASKFRSREMFGKAGGEVKYFGDVPPSAFTEVYVREFRRDKKGKLQVDERHIPVEYYPLFK